MSLRYPGINLSTIRDQGLRQSLKELDRFFDRFFSQLNAALETEPNQGIIRFTSLRPRMVDDDPRTRATFGRVGDLLQTNLGIFRKITTNAADTNWEAVDGAELGSNVVFAYRQAAAPTAPNRFAIWLQPGQPTTGDKLYFRAPDKNGVWDWRGPMEVF